MVRSSSDPTEAEIAITIIDQYQRIGLGALLMKLKDIDLKKIKSQLEPHLPSIGTFHSKI